MSKVDECSTFRSDIEKLYVDECYNVIQTRDELAKLGFFVSKSTLTRFLKREQLYRTINPHPRNEKKRRAIIKLRPEIVRMYCEEQMSFHKVNDELIKMGHKFSISMLRGYLIEWGVGRSLSEADAIRKLQPRNCQSCGVNFTPRSGQHQCCEVCSPRDWGYWYKFRLTPAMYEAMLNKQGGRCALCPRILKELPKRQVHVDHCHKTNVVRGILCSRCNMYVSVIDLYPGWGTRAEIYVKGL
jgi:hypothetical protein